MPYAKPKTILLQRYIAEISQPTINKENFRGWTKKRHSKTATNSRIDARIKNSNYKLIIRSKEFFFSFVD